MEMEKIDLKRVYKHLYSPSAANPSIVQVPDLPIVAIDGRIELGQSPSDSPQFVESIQAIYGAAFTLKFASKLRKENPIDYSVMPLESLWSTDSGTITFPMSEAWNFTLYIVQPEHITGQMFAEAIEKIRAKKDSPALAKLRFARFEEGECVQIMHIGPYSAELPTVEKLHAFARDEGYDLLGRHHEIYISDPSRTAPEKLKTIIRQPVRRRR